MIQRRIERGTGAFERDDFASALLEFRKVLAERPAFADVRNKVGLCLAMLDDLEGALSEFQTALEINPDYQEAELNRAIVLSELGRYEEARTAFDRAHALGRADGDGIPPHVGHELAAAHSRLGDLYRAAQQPERATQAYQEALQIRPSFLDIRAKLGETYLEMSDLDKAREELEAILARNPKLSGTRLHLGLVFHRMGDSAAAVREWERCILDDPTDLRARAYLASIPLALTRGQLPEDVNG